MLFGGAAYGSAVYGARGTAVESGVRLFLAGVPIPATWAADQLRIAEAVDQHAVCDVTLVARTGPARVTPGTRLDVRQDGVALFSGTVERTVDAILPGSARAVEIKVTAVDAAQVADRRLIVDRVEFAQDAEHPTGWRADAIVRALVTSYLAPEGITARSTECGSLVTAAFERQTVASALTQLADATGSVWRLAPTRDLVFGPRTLNQAPRTVTDSSPLEHASIERTRERFRTVQYGYSDRIEVAFEDSCTTSAGWLGWNSGRNAVSAFGNPGPAFLSFDGGRVFRDIGMIPGDTLELDVYLQSNNTTPEFSIRFLANSAGTGWHFRVGNTASQWFGLAVAPAQPSSGNGLFNAPAAVNTWHRVRIVTSETSASAYLDDVLYHTVVHSTYGGFVHLGDVFPSVYFDNIRIIPAPRTFLATVIDTTAVASVQAIEGGTGRYEALEVLSSLTRTPEVTSAAAMALRRFSRLPTILRFEDDAPGYRAGQLLPVHLTAFDLHEDMLIESVDLRLDADIGRMVTTVTAVSAEQQRSAVEFWRQALQ